METKNQFISTFISTQILRKNHSLGTAQNHDCEESHTILEFKKHVKIYHLNKKKKKKKNTNPSNISNIDLYQKIHQKITQFAVSFIIITVLL